MSIIPAKGVRLDLYEGSTLDRLFTFYLDAELSEVKDLTGYSAAMQVRKDFDSNIVLLNLTNGVLADPPASDVLVIDELAGTVRAYVRDETMATLNASQFTEVTDEGEVTFQGVWDLELTNGDGETSRYIMGPVFFSREVTHA